MELTASPPRKNNRFLTKCEGKTATKDPAVASFQSTLASFAFVRTPRLSQTVQGSPAPAGGVVRTPKRRALKSVPNPPESAVLELTSTDSNHRHEPPKKRKKVRGYAAPEIYAHLRDLQDILVEDLDVVFCGINPGQKSAEIGHHFGHPTNHFWGCLHESGFTSERLPPEEDHTLPARFSLGLTNLVDRATAEQNELSLNERAASVPALLAKVAKYRPRILCFIGLGIAKVVQTQLRPPKSKGKRLEKFKQGLQTYKIIHRTPGDATSVTCQETLFYALPCTSGRVINPQIQPKRADKIKLFKQLKTMLYQLKESGLNTDDMRIVSPP